MIKKYYKKCNLAKIWIKNPKMWVKILKKMDESKACQACWVTEQYQEVIKYQISQTLNSQKNLVKIKNLCFIKNNYKTKIFLIWKTKNQ